MKIKSFTYYKEKEKTTKNYKAVIIKEDDNYMEGVSLLDLSPEKQEEIVKIVTEFETKLQPFMSQYRRFKKSLIIKMAE